LLSSRSPEESRAGVRLIPLSPNITSTCHSHTCEHRVLQHTTATHYLIPLSPNITSTCHSHTCEHRVLQHTTATHYCSTVLQHSTAAQYCNTLLQHSTATHYCSTVLQHTTAAQYCNTVLQHTTATCSARISPAPVTHVDTCYKKCDAVACCRSVLQCVAVCCSRSATHVDTRDNCATGLVTWDMSHMRHVTHITESCHTHHRVMSHTWMMHANETCHTYDRVKSHTCACSVAPHIWMRHVARVSLHVQTRTSHACEMPKYGVALANRID